MSFATIELERRQRRAGETTELPIAPFSVTPEGVAIPGGDVARRRGARWAGPAVFLVTCLVFAPSLSNGFTHWDDPDYLTRNPLVHDTSPRGLRAIATSFVGGNYHPLTMLTYWVEHACFGLRPVVYHATNVLLHAGAAWIAFLLARRLFGRSWFALVAALLFAVHPLRVESVVWVAERKDVLSTFLYLLAFLFFDRSLPSRVGVLGDLERDRSRCWFALAAVTFLAALLAKVMAITLPAVLLVYLWARRRLDRTQTLRVASLGVVATGFAALGLVAQRSFDAIQPGRVGDLVVYVATVLKAVGFYVTKSLAPLDLSALYLFRGESFDEPLVLVGAACVVVSALIVIQSARRERALAFTVLLAWLAWAPVSGIIPSTTPVADRYSYLPSLGLVWTLALVATPTIRRWPRSCAVVLGAVLVALVCGTVSRIADWESTRTLWSSALALEERHPVAHNQLALHALESGAFEDAERHARRAIELGQEEPRYVFNLVLALRGVGDADAERALAGELRNRQPGFLPAWLTEARLLAEAGEIEAMNHVATSLRRLGPGSPESEWVDARRLEALGQHAAALGGYARCLAKRPGFRDAYVGLARGLGALGDGERALQAIARAIELDAIALFPDESRDLLQVVGTVEASGDPELARAAARLRAALPPIGEPRRSS